MGTNLTQTHKPKLQEMCQSAVKLLERIVPETPKTFLSSVELILNNMSLVAKGTGKITYFEDKGQYVSNNSVDLAILGVAGVLLLVTLVNKEKQ
jgi:hypothetical protein